jgi:lysophospholipase L1-like esterase
MLDSADGSGMTSSMLKSGFAALCLCLLPALASAEEVAGKSPVIPVPQRGMEKRHAEKVAAAKAGDHDLLMIGDSITHNFEKPEYQAVWNQFFAPRKALNLGYSGGRTENTLWNLQNGELEGQHPKVVTLLIGTNNSDDANYPVVHDAGEIYKGTAAIVALLREKLPDTKILLLKIFPRTNTYKKADGSPRGDVKKRFETNQKAGDQVAELADNKSVFFLDVNHVFLKLDGTIDTAMMPDQLHPSPAGAKAWAEAMEPLLSKLFGDEPKCKPSENNAVVPVPKLEKDFYDWWQRHEDIIMLKNFPADVVLIGDSITHFWGGPPNTPNFKPRGEKAFQGTFEAKVERIPPDPPPGIDPFTREIFPALSVLNLGFGWDRTQNVLWRLDHGELHGHHPKWAIVNIGTNNFAGTKNARENTPEEIAEGVRQILLRVRAKSSGTKIILMGVFPRGEKPSDPLRSKITELNKLLAKFGETKGITFLDITSKLTNPDGTISRQIMGDFLHPTEAGYKIWGDAVMEVIRAK